MRHLPYLRNKVRLSRSDLEGVLALVREAGELDTEQPFPSVLVDRLAQLVRCDDASYCEIDRKRGESTFLTGRAGEETPGPPEEAYWETVHEHPIRNYRQRTGDLRAHKIYDFVTPRQLRRTQFYADFIRPWATPFMMTVGLPALPGHTRTFVLEREQRCDFGERERTLLDVLQPHLFHIRSAIEVRRRARQRLASAPDGLLTDRETEVLTEVAAGLRNREIAQALWISPGTVRRHLDNIYAKLGVHTRTAAVRAAHEREGRV
jgi:DNA-binding CsgD family transcriptional regulator